MRKRFIAAAPNAVVIPTDTTPPTVPTKVVASNVTSTDFDLAWTASTDAVGVTGYSVQIDGVTVANPAGTTTHISGRTAATAYSVRVQARDAAGNFSALSTAVTVNTIASTTANLFSAQVPTTPDATDGTGVTLSTRFTSDADGNVTGMRFYRAATAPASVIGLLYTDAGTELARATFGTLTTGWNSVNFPTPVAIVAGTAYRVAYWSSGPYVASTGFFNTPVTNGHLTGTNGYFGYSATPASGTQQFNAGSYFADVLFTVTGAVAASTAPAIPAAPSVTAGDTSLTVNWVAPANGGSPITGYDVQPFAGATGGAVTSVGTATSTFLTGLTNGTAYTVKVRAKNAIGNSAYSAASAAATPAAPVGGSVTHGIQVTTANAGITAYTDPVLGRKITNADLTVHTAETFLSDITGPNTTLNRHWFQGNLIVNVANVTFNGCRFDHGVSGYWSGVHSPFTMNWCTIEGAPNPIGFGSVYYQDYTIYRCYIACEMDGLKANGGVTATECVIRVNTASADDHNDGAQSTGSYTGNLIQRCNIDARPLNGSGGGAGGPNAALFVADASSGLHVWTDNYLAGGGYVIRCYENATYNVQGNWVENNSWLFGPASRAVIPATDVVWGTVRPNLVTTTAGAQVSVIPAP